MSLDNIFNKPQYIHGVGCIYPVLLKDWDEFESNSKILFFDNTNLVSNDESQNYPLLTKLMYGFEDPKIFISLISILKIALRVDEIKSVQFTDGEHGLYIDELHVIRPNDYDEIRNIIIKQNIIILPKVYKNAETQKWAERVLEARKKNAPNVTLEDMITTVSVMKGVHYWDLENYNMYQLKSDFERVCQIKNNESESLVFANPYVDLSKVKISHFAESFDLYRSPYDDVFKDKSKLKLNNVV